MNKLNKNDIIKIFALIQAEFSTNKQLNNEMLIIRRDMWYDVLSMYSKEEVNKAVYEAITTLNFEPKLRDILNICKHNRNPYSVSPMDLWNNVIDAFSLVGDAIKDLEMGHGRAWNDYTQDFDNISYHDRGIKTLKEVFEDLCPEIKRYFGYAPERLAALYQMSAEDRSYEKARFLKYVQPFIDQQQTADNNGLNRFFEQLTSDTDLITFSDNYKDEDDDYKDDK